MNSNTDRNANRNLFNAAHKLAKSVHVKGDCYRTTFGAALRMVRAGKAAKPHANLDWSNVPIINKVQLPTCCPYCAKAATTLTALDTRFGVRRMKTNTKAHGAAIVVRNQSYCRDCRRAGVKR